MIFDTIYSLGSRCQNALILKKYGYRDFSGIFDYLNTQTVDRIIHILEDDFKELLDPNNNKMSTLGKGRVRTLNKFYDDMNDFHSATLCHHDITEPEQYSTIIRRRDRFKKLKHFNVLYNYTYNAWENDLTKDHMEKLVNILEKKYGNTNFKINFIALHRNGNPSYEKISENDKYDVFKLNINHGSYCGGEFIKEKDNENFMEIINSYDFTEPRLSGDEIDNHEF
jgi:disulfide oxidoreductase YuzD